MEQIASSQIKRAETSQSKGWITKKIIETELQESTGSTRHSVYILLSNYRAWHYGIALAITSIALSFIWSLCVRLGATSTVMMIANRCLDMKL
jgi:hypothetical protein